MSEFLVVFSAVVPVFGIVLVGLLVRRLNLLTEEADRGLLQLNIGVLFPCLIFDTVLGNKALSVAGNLTLAPLVGFLTVALGLLAGWAMSRWIGLKDPRQQGTFAVTVGVYNYGYVPLPLCFLLFGGTQTAGVLFVHNVGVELAMWTLGIMFLGGIGVVRDWRKMANTPILATVLAVGLNALGMQQSVPEPIRTAIKWLGQCAIPLSLVLIGAVIADHLEDFRSLSSLKVISAALALRIVLLPISFLLAAKYLPASVELKRVMVLQSAMPSAVFPIVMARHYGGDPVTAMRVVLGTSLVGLVTIPLWIRFGLSFVGL
jgi:predicted permease